MYETHRAEEDLLIELLPVLANFLLDFCPHKDDFSHLACTDLIEYVKSHRDNRVISYSEFSNFLRCIFFIPIGIVDTILSFFKQARLKSFSCRFVLLD